MTGCLCQYNNKKQFNALYKLLYFSLRLNKHYVGVHVALSTLYHFLSGNLEVKCIQIYYIKKNLHYCIECNQQSEIFTLTLCWAIADVITTSSRCQWDHPKTWLHPNTRVFIRRRLGCMVVRRTEGVRLRIIGPQICTELPLKSDYDRDRGGGALTSENTITRRQ